MLLDILAPTPHHRQWAEGNTACWGQFGEGYQKFGSWPTLIRHTKSFYTTVCFQLCGNSLGSDHILYGYWSSVLLGNIPSPARIPTKLLYTCAKLYRLWFPHWYVSMLIRTLDYGRSELLSAHALGALYYPALSRESCNLCAVEGESISLDTEDSWQIHGSSKGVGRDCQFRKQPVTYMP